MFSLLMRARRALILLIVLFCSISSCSPSSREWQYHESKTHIAQTNSARLILCPDVGDGPFELELIRSATGIRMYLNILRMEAPEHPDYPKKTTVDIVIDGESMTVHPYLLKGGQRLLFCDDVTQLVVNALLESKSIDINLGRRTLHLVSANFGAIYSSFVDSK